MANQTGFPSLLYLNPEERPEQPRLQPDVITDIGLERVMSPSVTEVLRTPATREDISARRELFSCLLDSGDVSALESAGKSAGEETEADAETETESEKVFGELRSALVELARAKTACETAQTPLEDSFLFVCYCEALCDAYEAVTRFSTRLPESCRMAAILADYMASDALRQTLEDLRARTAEARELAESITGARFGFTGNGIRLNRPDGDRSYIERIADAAKSLGYPPPGSLAAGEERITMAVSNAFGRLYPSKVAELANIAARGRYLLESPLHILLGELEFYLGAADLIKRAKRAGIAVSYPELSDEPRLSGQGAYDITLIRAAETGSTLVPNDLFWDEGRRFCFITGANGGGKTTYLRAVCGNLLLALAGCPVFCRKMTVYPFTKVFTHFPDDERFGPSGGAPGGRLADEIRRMDEIFKLADGDSFVFLNEAYSGAEEAKGCALTLAAAREFLARGTMGLYVTHFHEVNDIEGEEGCGFLSVSRDRSYHITLSRGVRRSFADDILRKYGLDRESLEKRISLDRTEGTVLTHCKYD